MVVTPALSIEVQALKAEGMEVGTIITMATGTGMAGMVGESLVLFYLTVFLSLPCHQATQQLSLAVIHTSMVMVCILGKRLQVVLPWLR